MKSFHLRAAAVLVAIAAVLGGGAVSTPAQATSPDPIVFVHGWNGDASGYDLMISWFESDGWSSDSLFAFSYDSSQSNVESAEELADYVAMVKERTGAEKVDIVAHSMGALPSRHFLKFLGGTEHVDDWASVAGPNHGTWPSALCGWLLMQPACLEMTPGSDFLTALNAGDETPGEVNYGTFRSLCDEAIIPNSSTILSGASNRITGCQEHALTIFDPYIYSLVRDFVA